MNYTPKPTTTIAPDSAPRGPVNGDMYIDTNGDIIRFNGDQWELMGDLYTLLNKLINRIEELEKRQS